MNNVLNSIEIYLPRNTFNKGDFLNILPSLNTKPINNLPNIGIDFHSASDPFVVFRSNNIELKIILKNSTGKKWGSPHKYAPVEVDEFLSRMKSESIKILSCDHLGINLPTENGVHQDIEKIISFTKSTSLLHSFPNNSDWFFIIPGTEEEILKTSPVDYDTDRKPKFEIVNFKKCSKPILQIDVATNSTFETLIKLFPEAIPDADLKNVWVYLKNNSGIDICFVLNEKSSGWTKFFKGQRLS